MTALGFGASGPWAERWFSEEKAYAVLKAAVAAGVRDLDTGPSYARGHAEARLGRLLARLAEEDGSALRLSSKVGTELGEGGRLIKAFEPKDIDRQLAASLAALGVARLDVLYLHGPDEHQLASALPYLDELKQTGVIEATGVVADGRFVSAAAAARPDWIMAPYNVLDQDNGPALARARAEGIKVAVVAPLAQGLWRRDLFAPRTLSGAWYAARALTRRDKVRTARRARWLRETDASPVELALGFVREALAPDLVLTTSTNPAHVAQSARALASPVPPTLAARLQGLMVS